MQYYNVHSHMFTMNNAPQKFLHLYLPGVLADAIDKITNVQAGSVAIQKLLMTFGGNGGKRYASFLKIGKSADQLEVFKTLAAQYPDDTSFKFVGLTMDMEKCGAGPSLSGYEGQLEEIIGVKKRYPDRLLLFLGVDPRWKATGKELLDTVKLYFETKIHVSETRSVYPFIGLKIYPSMGFYPFDERLMKTLSWAAENEVPVLSHCNFLGGIFNNDEHFIDSILSLPDPYNNNAIYPSGGINYKKHKSLGQWLLGRQTATNNLNKCSWLMEPNAFESMMTNIQPKRLKICLAHFGGGNQVKAFIDGPKASKEEAAPYGVLQKNWFTQIRDMMKRYTSLYTDISYALHDSTIHDQLITEIANSEYGNRIMFGTDYFLTEREGPEHKTYTVFKQKAASTPITNDLTAWDQVASKSVDQFLNSRFYNGTVI